MEGARGEERFSFNYRLNILFFFIFYFPFFCLKYLNFVKLDLVGVVSNQLASVRMASLPGERAPSPSLRHGVRCVPEQGVMVEKRCY